MIKFFQKFRQKSLTENGVGGYLIYAIGEILLVVVGILIAISIDNWNDKRKENQVEYRILTEIINGLNQDIIDIESNMSGHTNGIRACKYWRKIINQEKVDPDSISFYYSALTRDFISVQNTSGYESLKSKGLEFINNDSLRIAIITLYEQDYNVIRKLEEEYEEMQFYKNYFKEFTAMISPYLIFDQGIKGLRFPVNLNDKDKYKLIMYLTTIQSNRNFVLREYSNAQININKLLSKINTEIKEVTKG